ncbi:MAG TPA: PepSY domain-containing protein [Candidatus Acidoferrum sp.]|nr:PepSY domain-containing protein [Candidatus Acidoferrum sp.]
MIKTSHVLSAILVAGFTCLPALAQDKKLQRSDLPPAVGKTADEQSKGATVRGYSSEVEDGKLEYEVELTINGHNRDVSIDANGNVIEIEDVVEFSSLSPAVQNGLNKKAGTGKITKVESITKKGKIVAYEAHVLDGTKKREIQVGPDGKPLAHEE